MFTIEIHCNCEYKRNRQINYLTFIKILKLMQSNQDINNFLKKKKINPISLRPSKKKSLVADLVHLPF